MFTGIVSDVGTVRSVEQRGDMRLVVGTGYDLATVDLGASIACSGVCLTVVDKGEDWFAVDVSAETMSKTAAEHWREGAKLNLERALRLGDELGGHIVTGHVDAVAEVVGTCPMAIPPNRIGAFRATSRPMIAPKGSITLDGVSLTVNEVRDGDDGRPTLPSTSSRIPRSIRRWARLSGATAECRNRRAGALHRSDARRACTLGTHMFLLFITLQCDIAR